MPKYLDETGLARFWQTIKKEQYLKSMNGAMLSLMPVVRQEVLGTNGTSAQGFCIFGDNDEYCAWGFPTSDDSSTTLAIFTTSDNEEIARATMPLAHCNALSCRNDTLVTVNATTQTLYFIDVSNPLSPVVSDTVALSSGHSFATVCWYDDDTILGVDATSDTSFEFYLIDAASGNISATGETYDNTMKLVPQGISCDDKYIYRAYSDSNNVMVFDKTTFEVLYTFAVPNQVGFMPSNELTQAYVTDTAMYLGFNSYYAGHANPLPLLAKHDFEKSNMGLGYNITSANYRVVVDEENGLDIFTPNTHYTRLTFKRFIDALNFVNMNGACTIHISGNYTGDINIQNQSGLNIIFDANSNFTGFMSVQYSDVSITFESGSLHDTLASFPSTMSKFHNQSMQFYFYNSHVNIDMPIDAAYRNLAHTKLINNQQFFFGFRECVVNSQTFLTGFFSGNSIINANIISSPFFISSGNTISAIGIQCARDNVCAIYNKNSISSKDYSFRSTSSGSFARAIASGDVVPISVAYNLRLYYVPIVAGHREIADNPSNVSFGIRVPVYLSSQNKVVITNVRYESAAWPTQLTNGDLTIYGMSVAYGSTFWEANGTQIASGSAPDISGFMYGA